MCMCMCVCMCVYLYVFVCIYMYLYVLPVPDEYHFVWNLRTTLPILVHILATVAIHVTTNKRFSRPYNIIMKLQDNLPNSIHDMTGQSALTTRHGLS